MRLSSINFQKSKSYALSHNLRKESKKEAKYLLPVEARQENEYWTYEKNGKQIFEEELAKANRKGGQIPKLENSLWEAVVNLDERHNIENVKELAQHIEEKFNIKCYAIAVHKDEGYIDKETNETKYNYHAHLNFCTYKDGKQNWRKELIKPKDLSDLQTKTAEILKMVRGESKEISKNERLEHKEYKYLAKIVTDNRSYSNKLQAENEELKKLANSKDLQEENRKLRELLKEKIEYLNKTILNSLESKKEENQVNDILEQKENELDSLKLKYEALEERNNKLEKENEDLKEDLNIYQKLHSLLEDYMPKIAQFMNDCLQKWSKDVDKNEIKEVLKEELGIEEIYTQQKRSRGR